MNQKIFLKYGDCFGSTCLSSVIGSTRFFITVKWCPERSIFFSLNLISILLIPISGNMSVRSDTSEGENIIPPPLIWGRLVFSRWVNARLADMDKLYYVQ